MVGKGYLIEKVFCIPGAGMTDKQHVAYGFWRSPITAAAMGAQTPLTDVQWDSDGQRLVWLERRSDRGVLVCRAGEDAPYDVTDAGSVRGMVGYGGGDFTVSHGHVIYAEKSGRLYRQSLEPGSPQPITPAFGMAASPVVSDDGQWVLFVHSYERKDVIGLVDCAGARWPVNLVTGADFYMQPTWHPAGDRIAWIEWDHPSMPWDGTRLKMAQLEGDPPGVTEQMLVAGGPETPVFQPAFSPDGNWLAYIATEEEWDRLAVLDLASGERRVLAEGMALAEPAWVQGIRVYGWSADSAKLFYHRNDRGFGSLWQVDRESGHTRQMDTAPYTWLSQVAVSPVQDVVACIASSPAVPDRIVAFHPGRQTVHRRSRSERIPPEALPTPHPLTWQAPDGTTVHGLYYAPANPQFAGAGLPPAVVSIHGGPTSQRTAAYSSDAAFFTSRGYAFLEVNYRGSTGYGRSYMTALRGRWGEYDTEDAAGAAQALIAQGLADPKRLVIKGGSAGGYTVLNTLIHHPGVFRAGVCLYGVTNLFALAADTHKFEERYLDSMVGPLPEAGDRYQAWSPLFHADRLRDPVAIFQGSEDKVVPPDQAESIVKVLQRNGVPHIYRLYEGEGHGWRRTETIVAYYDDVERFLKQYVLIG
jgi:dipeptidyl aminopeptidase/acylaminoacyl peptidase